ncbi:hypothetical protein AAMO2058_001398700 [Amorphochlora amoebiformis]
MAPGGRHGRCRGPHPVAILLSALVLSLRTPSYHPGESRSTDTCPNTWGGGVVCWFFSQRVGSAYNKRRRRSVSRRRERDRSRYSNKRSNSAWKRLDEKAKALEKQIIANRSKSMAKRNITGRGGRRKSRMANFSTIAASAAVAEQATRSSRRRSRWGEPESGVGNVLATPEQNLAEFQVSSEGGIPLAPAREGGGLVPMTKKGITKLQEYYEDMQIKVLKDRKSLAATLQEDRYFSRVYVTNLPVQCNPDEIRDFFNRVMEMGQGPHRAPGASVTQVFHNPMGRYAYVEFRTAEEAVQILDVGQLLFFGVPVKIGRPANHNEDKFKELWGLRPKPPPLDLAPLGVRRRAVGPTVEEGPNKIYASGFPIKMYPEQIQEIFEAFGPLKGLFLPRDPITGQLRGWCFAQYQDPHVTQRAVRGLHGMRLLSQNLQVRQAQQAPHLETDPYLDPARAFGDAPGLRPLLPSMVQMAMIKPGSTSSRPTRVVVLLGCVSTQELAHDIKFLELYNDVLKGVKNFGNVTKLIMPRPNHGLPGVGRVYVQFENLQEAKRCAHAMKGASFQDNIIQTVYWPEERFEKLDLH